MPDRRHVLLGLTLLPLGLSPAGSVLAQGATRAASVGEVVGTYSKIVHASYVDTRDAAVAMRASIRAFTATPSAEALAAARKSWLAAREFYGQTEAFRFYGGPIDDDRGPEGRINAWPMDEGYVDGIEGKAGSGLVNNRKFTITKRSLSAQNERGGEENIATGWHAIEFLLWGQDLSADGPGARSFEDYVDGKRANADRRRQYLRVVTDLLIDDLDFLVRAWEPGKPNFRARFDKGGNESLRRIFVGLGSLSRGELAGERLEVALASQDQEDEHSCFSDNTHRDVVTNVLGIQNVWLGRYRRADGSTLEGTGVAMLVAGRDAALAERTTKRIAASLAAAEALQPPFDREIVGDNEAAGRKRIRTLVASLVEQSNDLVAAAAAAGITRLTLVDPKK